MKIIPFNNQSLGPQDPNKYNDFSRFNTDTDDFVFIESSWFDDEDIIKKSFGKKIVYIEFEEPNRFLVLNNNKFIPNTHDYFGEKYQKILTICPFTAKWLNKKNNTKKRIPVFQPFNEQFIPPQTKKKIEVIYTGHIVSPEITRIIETISNFNYRFVSNSDSPLVTNKSISYKEKLKLISETRISVVHNLLYPEYQHIQSVWQIPDYYENKAFKLVPKKLPDFIPNILKRLYISKKTIIIPQVKQRLFEAAFCRSLILCRKDPFNVIEYFFTPGKEFIYYEDGKLYEKITEILSDFEQYQQVIDNAFKKADSKYTTKEFVKKYLTNIF